jgi:hypothetical protein
MSYFAMVPTKAPLAVLKFPKKAPLAPCGSHAKHRVIPHSPEQDTLPIVFLISKQVIPYQTHGGTYCPGVSTPKFRSLVDLSNHIT